MTGQVPSLSSQRKRSEQRIQAIQALTQILIVTNLTLDYTLITENSLAASRQQGRLKLMAVWERLYQTTHFLQLTIY